MNIYLFKYFKLKNIIVHLYANLLKTGQSLQMHWWRIQSCPWILVFLKQKENLRFSSSNSSAEVFLDNPQILVVLLTPNLIETFFLGGGT